MRDDDSFSWVSFVVLILLIGSFSFVFIRFGEPLTVTPVKPIETIVDTGRCSEIVRRCRAEADVTFESASEEGFCDERKGRQRIETLLGNPITSGDCPHVLEEMEANCPAGCRLAHERNLVIPGKLRVSISERIDTAGKCHARGEVGLTVRGSCIR